MSDLLERLDRTPATYVALLAYVTLAFLTDPIRPTIPQLVEHGAAVGLLVQDGQIWRLWSHAFLHGGLVHLLFNGYCLFVVGPLVEMSLGSVRFVLLYAVAALAGAVNAILFYDPRVPLIGGSGALFGMFGALLALQMRSGRGVWDFMQFRGPRSIVTLIVLNLVLGFIIPGISNAAHIGGLIAGFVLVFCFLDRGRHDAPDWISRLLQASWIALLVGLTWHAATLSSNQTFVRLRTVMRHAPEKQAIEFANQEAEVLGRDIGAALRRLRR